MNKEQAEKAESMELIYQKIKLADFSEYFISPCKVIAICGGVMSSLGKGITTSSLGLLLK